MKKLFLISSAALCLCIESCVNNDYDLADLDTTMTVLPGLSIPLNDAKETSVDFGSLFTDDENQAVTKEKDGSLVIGKNEKSTVTLAINEETLNRQSNITVPGTIEIQVATVVGQLLPNAHFTLPFMPELEINNPTHQTMELYGEISCNGETVSFGPYNAESGKSTLVIDDPDVEAFFSPVRGDIVIHDMYLSGAKPEKMTKMEEESFSICGFVPMELTPNSTITVEYIFSEDDLAKVNLEEFAREYNAKVESFTAVAEITNSIPLEISAEGEAVLDKGKAKANVSPVVKAGEANAPVKTEVQVKFELPEGSGTIKSASITATGKCMSNTKVAIQENHNISFKIKEAIFESGITVEP